MTRDNALYQFARRLAHLRRQARLSQEALAEKANLSCNYIGLLECQRRCPSLLTILRIQKALNVKIHDLLPDAMFQEVFPQEDGGEASLQRDQLLNCLKKCSEDEIAVITKIVKQVLRLKKDGSGAAEVESGGQKVAA